MRTISLMVSERQFIKYKLADAAMPSLDELIRQLKKEIAREALRKCRSITQKSALKNLTMAEIDAEIYASRLEKTETNRTAYLEFLKNHALLVQKVETMSRDELNAC